MAFLTREVSVLIPPLVCTYHAPPFSGPKRYDLIDGYWKYHHDNTILHDLLSKEFTEHLDSEVDLTKLENYHRLADGDAWS